MPKDEKPTRSAKPRTKTEKITENVINVLKKK